MADWKKDHIPDPRDTSFTEDLGKAEGTMIDDPRAILKAADVECAELTDFLSGRGPSEWEDDDGLDAAFRALARLVAERERMLRLAWKDGHLPIDSIEIWLANLRARAE